MDLVYLRVKFNLVIGKKENLGFFIRGLWIIEIVKSMFIWDREVN